MSMVDVRKELIQKGAYELLPYVSSLLLKYKFAILSYASVIHAEKNLQEKMHSIKLEKEEELNTKGSTSWGVNDRNRWNIDIEGFEVDVIDYVNKGIWELIHYSRICLEVLPQIINIAIFDYVNRVPRKNISLSNFEKKIPASFNSFKELLQQTNEDKCCKYIKAADNYLKHVDEIPVKLRTRDFLREYDSFIISDFELGGDYYESRIVEDLAEQIKEFVEQTISAFLQILITSDIATKEKKNYITDVSYEALMNGNTLDYLAFFIDVPEVICSIQELFDEDYIYIRPIIVDNEYNIYDDSEFSFDTIFVRQEVSRNIIGIAKVCNPDDDGFYKQYTVEPCTKDIFDNYMKNFKDNYNKVIVKNMLAYRSIEKRKI